MLSSCAYRGENTSKPTLLDILYHRGVNNKPKRPARSHQNRLPAPSPHLVPRQRTPETTTHYSSHSCCHCSLLTVAVIQSRRYNQKVVSTDSTLFNTASALLSSAFNPCTTPNSQCIENFNYPLPSRKPSLPPPLPSPSTATPPVQFAGLSLLIPPTDEMSLLNPSQTRARDWEASLTPSRALVLHEFHCLPVSMVQHQLTHGPSIVFL